MATNAFFGLLSYATAVILAFFISPFIFQKLGDARYGVWALFGELLSYYGLFDLGVRGAINYFVGRSLASDQKTSIQGYVSSAFVGLLCLSGIAAIVGVVVIFLLQDTLVTASVNRLDVLGAASLFLLLFFVGMPLEVFSAVLVGGRRAHLVSSSEIVGRVVSAILMCVGLVFVPSLMVLVLAQAVGRLGYWMLIQRHVRRYVPEARVSLRMARYADFKELFGYGSQNAVLNFAWLLSGRKDVTIITIMLGPMWVATYTFARLLIVSVSDLTNAVTQTLRPNLIYHWARREFEEAYTIYYTASRYSSFMATTAAAFLLMFGKSFLALWIGERFVSGSMFYRTDFILYVLIAAHLPRMMHNMSWQLLLAANKQRSFMVVAVGEAVLSVGLAIVLVQYWGVLGLAIATMIQMFISYLVIMPLLISRLVGVQLGRYFTEGIARSLIAALILTATGWGLQQLLPVTGWPTMLRSAVIYGVVATVLGGTFVIRPADRSLLIQRAVTMLASIRSAAKGVAA